MRIRILFALAFAAAIVLMNVAAAGNIACGVGVVVIDPGHGGKLPGAHYGGVYEKDIVLQVALKLGKLIEEGMPGVKVVYTRTTDKMLGTTKTADLQARADIANKNKGELFISIHANAAVATAARGVEVLVMGETPKEQQYNTNALYESNREDLIDLATEPDAPIVRARIQNMQFTYGEYSMAIARCIERNFTKSGFTVRRIKPQLLRVLYATDMPGVLTEIGFMSNAKDMAHMKSEKGQYEIARSLFRAVRDYSDYVLGTRLGDGDAPAALAGTGESAGNDGPGFADAAAVPQKREPDGKTAQSSAGKTDEAGSAGKSAQKQVPVRYTVQVLSEAKPVALRSQRFKSYRGKVKQYRGDGSLPYKYCVGLYETRDEARRRLPQVQTVFPDAFVVRCRGTEIVK